MIPPTPRSHCSLQGPLLALLLQCSPSVPDRGQPSARQRGLGKPGHGQKESKNPPRLRTTGSLCYFVLGSFHFTICSLSWVALQVSTHRSVSLFLMNTSLFRRRPNHNCRVRTFPSSLRTHCGICAFVVGSQPEALSPAPL